MYLFVCVLDYVCKMYVRMYISAAVCMYICTDSIAALVPTYVVVPITAVYSSFWC